MVKGRHAQFLVVKTLLHWVIQLVESDWLENLLNTKLFNLFISVEAEGNSSQTVLDRPFVNFTCH
jgi:hypothetical protein